MIIQEVKPQIYSNSLSASAILATAMETSTENVQRGLIALFKAGFTVAPVVPTNSMLYACLNAINPGPKRMNSVLTAIAKANRRWRAMALVANEIALSNRAEADDATPDFRCACLSKGAAIPTRPTLAATSSKAPSDTKAFGKIARGDETQDITGNYNEKS